LLGALARGGLGDPRLTSSINETRRELPRLEDLADMPSSSKPMSNAIPPLAGSGAIPLARLMLC